ncbi:MAG: YkgJ family cysteine cluster protein [Humidesulfovibrio sp.]|nr:YkgJ family cysteine cluster protein [Humidesulfovibrio sp.]
MKPAPPNATAPCRRCGACCHKGGPALHAQDLPLFQGPDALSLSLVVTLRAGELVHDQPRGRLLPLTAEVLKLRGGVLAGQGGQGGQACALLSPADTACTLYERRPAECRALSCQDTAGLAAMYDQDRLARADLLPAGHGLLAVMAEHEALVPVARIAPLAAALRSGGQEALDAEEELTRMALADRAFRTGLSERAGIGPEYHECFLGRAIGTLFAAAGLALRADARTGLRVQPDPLRRSPLPDAPPDAQEDRP